MIRGGVSTDYILDGKKIIEKRSQDVEPILDRNKRLANMNDGYSPDRTWRRAATIPFVVIEIWMRESGLKFGSPEFDAYVVRKLNDPDWKYLRTAPGRL